MESVIKDRKCQNCEVSEGKVSESNRVRIIQNTFSVRLFSLDNHILTLSDSDTNSPRYGNSLRNYPKGDS